MDVHPKRNIIRKLITCYLVIGGFVSLRSGMHGTTLLRSVRLVVNNLFRQLHKLLSESHIVGLGATLLSDPGRCN